MGAIALLALAALLVCPLFGAVELSPKLFLQPSLQPEQAQILFHIRIPRVLFAFTGGAALSLAGLVFQALLRNPLASPFTLGVASGAAFGTALFFNLDLSFSLLAISGETWSGMSGALLTIVPIFFVIRGFGLAASTEILLAGVVLSLFFSSLVIFLQCLADFSGVMHITRWLMGGFEVVGYASVLSLFLFVLLGFALAYFYRIELNLLALGHELARSRGLNSERVGAILFLGNSILVGAVVSFCGPISTVGIMAPHIARLILGHDHRVLVPMAFLLGGTLVVVCDTIARTVIAPYEIPVGVITALIEGPFFLWLLSRRRAYADLG